MLIENERFESDVPAPDIHNPVELILREASARTGPLGGDAVRLSGASSVGDNPPDFETGVDEDGNDTDLMIWGHDTWGDPLRHWSES